MSIAASTPRYSLMAIAGRPSYLACALHRKNRTLKRQKRFHKIEYHKILAAMLKKQLLLTSIFPFGLALALTDQEQGSHQDKFRQLYQELPYAKCLPDYLGDTRASVLATTGRL
jgi:hypothetical protein